MKKKSDKKTVIILLIVLAIVAIASGIWTYNTLQPLEGQGDFLDIQSDIQIEEVFGIKDKAIQNIEDFLEADELKFTIWKDFYNNDQFNRLEDLDINIDIDDYINNPNPFVAPTSTDEIVTKNK
jgi:hypothetical protein